MGQFLAAFDHLIKRGMRFDYQRVEEEQRYLRGQGRQCWVLDTKWKRLNAADRDKNMT